MEYINKTASGNLHSVVFDFDGTLADTEDMVFTIYLDLADKFKLKKVSKDELYKLKKLSAFEVVSIEDLRKIIQKEHPDKEIKNLSNSLFYQVYSFFLTTKEESEIKTLKKTISLETKEEEKITGR